MHELGIVFEVVKRVDAVAIEQQIDPSEVASVVLEVGEASTIIPKYLKECWPAAIDGTNYEHTSLEVEICKAIVKCRDCGEEYYFLDADRKCPKCGCEYGSLLQGKEFNIKEILLFEETENEQD